MEKWFFFDLVWSGLVWLFRFFFFFFFFFSFSSFDTRTTGCFDLVLFSAIFFLFFSFWD